MIRLISTDFDGTIHDPSVAPPIPPELVDRIHAVHKSGTKWVLNTGRELHDVVAKIRSLQVGHFPDFIVTVERQIYHRSQDDYLDHADWNMACHAEHQALFAEAVDSLNHIRQWVEARFTARLYSDSWSPLCIVAMHSSDADHIHQWVMEECRRVPSLSVMRNTHYFRFNHVRYTKGTALGEIARLLRMDRDEVFAIGDHYNDIPMLDGTHAAWVAAPSNAIPEVKAVVSRAKGYLAARPYGLGVVDALNFFLDQSL